MMTDLVKYRDDIIAAASIAYHNIKEVPAEIRQDDKIRTGIQVLVRQPGTRNVIYFSVGKPSEAAMFFSVEKAVRSYLKGDAASQNSENEEMMEFRGSVTVEFNGIEMQASTSGLLGSEDVATDIIALAQVFNVSTQDICINIIQRGGMIPGEFFNADHYLGKIVGMAK